MKDQALRLALEALGHFEKAGLATLKTIDAITAIKQALEQPAPYRAVKTYHDGKPVYVQEPPKREWQGLTDDEYSQLHDGLYQQGKSLGWVVDQIEEKLKERNL